MTKRSPCTALAAAACLAVALPAAATPATAGATGRICGASRCVTLPRPLAIELSQRNDGFEPLATPRRAPFYRITIKATGHGYINKTIVWVPAAHAWFVEEHVANLPDTRYWRTEEKATRAALTR